MNSVFPIGLLVLLALYILGRFISSGAARLLTAEDKARLVDFSVQQRKITLALTLLLVAVLFLGMRYVIFLFLLVVGILIWYQQRKLKFMDFPRVYRTRLLIGSLLTFTGIGLPLLYYYMVFPFLQ